MKLVLERLYFKETYTVGHLFADGEYFCDTLEDRARDLLKESKIYGKTAIPQGAYDVELTYSERFKCVLPLLKDVPNFSGIRIHAGNTDKDTEGCILVGKNKVKGMVVQSRETLALLMEKLKGQERISIEVV